MRSKTEEEEEEEEEDGAFEAPSSVGLMMIQRVRGSAHAKSQPKKKELTSPCEEWEDNVVRVPRSKGEDPSCLAGILCEKRRVERVQGTSKMNG